MERQKGSITIYLSLSLVLILALLCTLIESGRVNCINAKLKGITYMAADSCFSEYVREIFDEYGIMMLWMDDAEFTGEFNSFINSNLTTGDKNIYSDADLYLMQHDGSAITELIKITDDNGKHFENQVCDYMKYYSVSEIVQKLLSEIDFFNQGQKLSAFVDKVNEYKDVFINVGSAVSNIQQYIDRAKSIAYNPKTLLGKMRKNLNQFNSTGNVLYAGLFNSQYWRLAAGRSELESCMNGIISEIGNYYEYSGQAKEALSVINDELNLDSDDYSEKTLESIKSEIESLINRTGNGSDDYYNVEKNEVLAETMQKKLGNLNVYISELSNVKTYSDISDYTGLTELFDDYFQDFDVSALGITNSETRVKKENSGFISTVSTIFTKGLLAAVTDGNISDNKINKKDMPSENAGRGFTLLNGIAGSTTLNKVMVGEYILTHFGSYMNQNEDTALKYEVEYILSGKASDRDNLKAVIKEIALLRTGLNMISFMQDSAKMEEAEALAFGIMGFTGNEAFIESMKLIIVTTWCIAESLCDVKALLQGRKVTVIKSNGDWTISAVGLTRFSKSIVPSAYDNNGIGYDEYLRILLLTKDNAEQEFGAMDMIQANMCKKYNSAFRVINCIDSIKMQVQYEARPLFMVFPFVTNLIGNGNGNYGFSYSQAYSYD